jgi:hypothetical protein
VGPGRDEVGPREQHALALSPGLEFVRDGDRPMVLEHVREAARACAGGRERGGRVAGQECGQKRQVTARPHVGLELFRELGAPAFRHDDGLGEGSADVEPGFLAELGHHDFRGVVAGRFRVERTRPAISP